VFYLNHFKKRRVLELHIAKNKIHKDSIREARNRAGLNQNVVSERVGIFRSYLSRIETGNANPTLLVMDAIAKALKAELWELLN
jgi:transcriptional regulator with XRE-family HTH domain